MLANAAIPQVSFKKGERNNVWFVTGRSINSFLSKEEKQMNSQHAEFLGSVGKKLPYLL